MYVHLSIYLSLCLSICLTVCLSVYLSIYHSFLLSIYLSVYLSISGCFPCSSCVVDLMESLNEIITDLSPIMEEFKETEKSYFAYKRLNFIDKEIDQQVLGIALLDPVKANRRIKPLADRINALLLKSGSLNVDFKLNMMKELTEQSGELSVDGSNAVAEMGEVGVNIMKVGWILISSMALIPINIR